jgi:hypothetical protein
VRPRPVCRGGQAKAWELGCPADPRALLELAPTPAAALTLSTPVSPPHCVGPAAPATSTRSPPSSTRSCAGPTCVRTRSSSKRWESGHRGCSPRSPWSARASTTYQRPSRQRSSSTADYETITSFPGTAAQAGARLLGEIGDNRTVAGAFAAPRFARSGHERGRFGVALPPLTIARTACCQR